MDERKKGGCITLRHSFLYLILTRKLQFLDNIRRISLVKWTGWGIHRGKSIQLINQLLHYTRIVYRRILNFFTYSIWIMLFFKWFFLWVRQSFMSLYIRHRNSVIVLCEFCLCLIVFQKWACVQTADLCKYVRYVFESWCRVYSVENYNVCSMKFDHAWN